MSATSYSGATHPTFKRRLYLCERKRGTRSATIVQSILRATPPQPKKAVKKRGAKKVGKHIPMTLLPVREGAAANSSAR
jgi:hypothetical protein